MKNLGILIIEKNGNIKTLCIKDYKEEELYKKCGFTKSDDFIIQTEWTKKVDNISYTISVFGKTKGKANYENKYDFIPFEILLYNRQQTNVGKPFWHQVSLENFLLWPD